MRLDIGNRLGKIDPATLKDAPGRLLDDAQKRAHSVRHDLYTRRQTSRVKLWTLSADALEKAHEALENAPSQLAPVADRLGKAVEEGLDLVTSPTVANYDTLNVNQVAAAVEGLDLVELERVVRYEQANKDRVTVYRAVDREKALVLKDPTAVV
jgi:hypothetical protein